MNNSTWILRPISASRRFDVLCVVSDYDHLAVPALAARERHAAMITESVRRDRACLHASRRERFWGWFCRHVIRRDASSDQIAPNPPVMSPASLEQPAATVGV
jgi:hypothetical protein